MNTKRAPYGTWKCHRCEIIFNTRAELFKHNREIHPVPKGQVWNKGLTKELDKSILHSAETYKSNLKTGKIKVWCQGKELPEEMKLKISNGMIHAHTDGRAYVLGKNRWNHEPSYPEKWFKQVVDNEFINKSCIQEYHVGSYYLDFAWVDLKKCIEMDGQQHYRFQTHIEHDAKRDKFLINNGWQVLRLSWAVVLKNPKHYIQLAKDFIEK